MQNKIIGSAIGAVIGFFLFSGNEKTGISKKDAKNDLPNEKEKSNNKKESEKTDK